MYWDFSGDMVKARSDIFKSKKIEYLYRYSIDSATLT